MERVGFIGLGRMGRPMSSNLRRKQFALSVFDTAPAAMTALEELGADRASSPAELARGSSIVVTMLPGPREVREVVLGADGLLAHLAPPGQARHDHLGVAGRVDDKHPAGGLDFSSTRSTR